MPNPNELAPLTVTPGALRFNTDSMKLEYYRGGPVGFGTTTQTGEWVNLTTDSPDIQTGGARGLFGGGYSPGSTNTIDYINISSTGNAITFGELIGGVSFQRSRSAASSSTRGVWGGGSQEPSTNTNAIDFVTISSTGNSQDFGDLTVARRGTAAVSSSTRGVWAGGRTPTIQNVMDYITIASTGNAQDFGDLSRSNGLINPLPAQSSTRGIFAGGYTPITNSIDFITISTQGNSADFGDLTVARGIGGGCSNAVRGLFGGGYGGGNVNVIDYVTIATLGNATDFGDLLYSGSQISACSSPTRGVWAGGYVSPATTNNINYVTIMSTGNAIDFGDLTAARYIRNAGCSNGHGGLG